MCREELTDAQWADLSPLLPALNGRGRPYLDHRPIVSGILWAIRTGAPWRDVPERFGKWTTIYSRFRRWTAQGVWQRVFTRVLELADRAGQLDWSTHFVDGTVVRAHPCAAGARGGQQHEALGRSRGGFGTKIHLRAEGHGRPFAFVPSGGERHEAAFFDELMRTGAVKRGGRGRPKIRPVQVVGDKGYSYHRIQRDLRRRGIRVVVPRRTNQPSRATFDAVTYRERNRVERLVGRMKRWQRVATRYEKRASHFAAVVTVVAVLEWLPLWLTEATRR
ncbi:IS5 family transposase [Deinococcus pimensis]|uniref:IS5 family transposase n=1 Tax=Deinococcus pimensis TaxID=309888 RepID=UPI00048124FD|nr:IS5 family transposase [Deinococcus pimensis]